MWLPDAIARWAAMFKSHPSDRGVRFNGSDLEAPSVVGSLRPDAVGNGEPRLPGFYFGSGDELTPFGEGGIPLTAKGNPLHDSSGRPLT